LASSVPMVGTGITATILACVLLAVGTGAVTINTEKDSVVRRERHSVELTADGEIVQQHVKMSSQKSEPEQSDSLRNGLCNLDFVEGTADTSNCSDDPLNPTNHTIIFQESLCKAAADYSGAGQSVNGSMQLAHYWEHKRPRGCFKESCTSSPSGACYMINMVGELPPNPVGMPICTRPRNLLGIKDAQTGAATSIADKETGCPKGYKVIDDYDKCIEVSNCLNYAGGDNFVIGTHNASRHLEYPRGCFIDNQDNKTYFNPANPVGDGLNVLGTPICNVSTVVRWGAGGVQLNSPY